MENNEIREIEIKDDLGKFAETYSSFNKIINKLQAKYLTLQETYSLQSEELQTVNKSLQSLMKENRAVTEFLNSILNSLSSGVIAVDTTGRVSHMNPTAKRILGIVKDEDPDSPAMAYENIIPAVDNPECSALTAIRKVKNNINGEKKVKTHMGTVITLNVSTSLLLNRSGAVVGAVELFQDITKMKAMEDQLSHMKVLASMGEMAATIAHEIRNPLVGIGGFASLLARDLADDPPKRNMAKKVVEGVESINSIIQTLLDFARKEKLAKSRVDLNSYLKNTLDDFLKNYPNRPDNNELQISLPGNESIYVELDRGLFRRVICNLIKNGLEASRESNTPKVEIKTRLLPIDSAHNIKNKIVLSGTETLAEIIITDNGPGISKEDLDRLFSPFYTTKENGIGLGLSIAWKIIKVHGGHITAESVLGKGTKFSILLPVKSIQHGVAL
ncbi:MAG: ATP-binding protein [Candidatus Zixiibacteriota bacterium]